MARARSISLQEDPVPEGHLTINEIAELTGEDASNLRKAYRKAKMPFKEVRRLCGNNVHRVRYYPVIGSS